jgi:hypothetical protein
MPWLELSTSACFLPNSRGCWPRENAQADTEIPGVVLHTFTPLEGLTETDMQFMPQEMRPTA